MPIYSPWRHAKCYYLLSIRRHCTSFSMFGSSNLFPSLLLATVVAFLGSALLPVAQACNNQTLELCSEERDCTGSRICLGRLPSGDLSFCPSGNVETCRCAPPGAFVDCTSDKDCPEFEGCAISPATGRKLCVGCRLINDPAADYRPTGPNRKNCAKRRPQCGRTFDFCSPNRPCLTRLDCVSRMYGGRFLCGDSGVCRCEPRDSGNPKPCDSSRDCPSREVCATNERENETVCTACDIARADISFKPFSLRKCRRISRRPFPKYPSSSNGRNFDLCANSVMCDGGRSCVKFRDILNPEMGFQHCSSINELCFCYKGGQKCQASSECAIGENCADVKRLGVTKECVSIALLESIASSEFTRYGDRGVPQGNGLTGVGCKYDWDCKRPRRCTHVSDIFGGCAGRRSCTCEPLLRQVCSTKSGCPAGETCVNYADAATRPFCISRPVESSNRDLVPVNSLKIPSPKPLRDGLSLDPCRSDSDCLGSRRCEHVTESAGGCNGRRSCVCKAVSNRCQKSSNCDNGEVCARIMDQFPLTGFCASREAVTDDVFALTVEELNSIMSFSAGPRWRPDMWKVVGGKRWKAKAKKDRKEMR